MRKKMAVLRRKLNVIRFSQLFIFSNENKNKLFEVWRIKKMLQKIKKKILKNPDF